MRVAFLALLLAGCSDTGPPDPMQSERGVLRMKLAQSCLKNLPAGPVSTQYNDWDEVVQACSETAFYQSNHCKDPSMCLRALAESEKPQ